MAYLTTDFNSYEFDGFLEGHSSSNTILERVTRKGKVYVAKSYIHGTRQFQSERIALQNVYGLTGVVQLIDSTDDRLILEYIDGKNLQTAKPISLPGARAIIFSIADTLLLMEEKGVRHRDIKPANIMLIGNSYLTKLIDFGMATVDGSSPLWDNARKNTIYGTLGYIAPEVICSGPSDEQDVFSLGSVLYEIMTGKHPFNEGLDEKELGPREYGIQSTRAVMEKDPERNERLSTLEDTIMHMLEKDRKKRLPLNNVPQSLVQNLGLTVERYRLVTALL